jgi:hypothetical protein
MSEPVGVPAPPPGPGVTTPFAAPPRDRDNKGLFIGLGIGGLVIVLCCVGGILGFGLLSSGSDSLVRGQASAVVEAYLQDLVDENYPDAYGQLCSQVTEKITESDFSRRVRSPHLQSFQVEGATIGQTEITVTVATTYEGQGAQRQLFPVVQDGTSLKVCPAQ